MFGVIKRNGKRVEFDSSKIVNAIDSASKAANETIENSFYQKVITLVQQASNDELDISVDQIQTMIEFCLMSSVYKKTAKKYIIYRNRRDLDRDKESTMIKTFNEIVEVADNFSNRENANINADIPAGQMMKFASESAKNYALNYIVSASHAKAHKNGDIHIHDLDFVPSRTTTCVHYDLEAIFKDGFTTTDGAIRSPKTIRAAASLAAIVFQSNQNEQHGGQSIPAFDFFMAKYVRMSFVRHLVRADKREGNLPRVTELYGPKDLCMGNKDLQERFPTVYRYALEDTIEETAQAMEAFIANLNSMHSRGGGQTVFSSINYGTDESEEGRLVMQCLLDATERGLGDGGTATFPIQVFKVKNGVSFSEEDWYSYRNHLEGEPAAPKFAPNFDLFVRACEVSAKRLFPNFLYLDATFNQHEDWKAEDPKRWEKEVATMGCRTRVFENIHGEKTSIGRGNISFTTLNIVRLAIEAAQKSKKDDIIDNFFESLDKTMDLVAEQLYGRYQFQRKAKAKQYPFLLGQNVWRGGDALNPNDHVGDVLNSGTLGIGFIGLAECLKALTGKHHGESDEAQALGLKIVKYMSDKAACYKEAYNLNYSLLATPAEGLSGRFTGIDREKYGTIPGITDRSYYTNSSHIPVYYGISAYQKIQKEAPYHDLCRGGHIAYVEIDGEAKKNLLGFMTIIVEMYKQNVGYGAINHPIDRCLSCSHEGVIKDACPVCQEKINIDRICRITGYLVGTVSKWNKNKKEELKDRIKHS